MADDLLLKAKARRRRAEAESEPSLMDKAKSYGMSAYSGLSALPKGAFQLGANIGDFANEFYESEMGRGGMELTEGAKETAIDAGMELPEEYKRYGFGDAVNKQLEKEHAVKQALMKKAGREDFDWVELGGMVSSPASFMRTGLTAAPKIASSGLPIAKSLPSKILEGGKVGTMYGAGMPVVGGDNYLQDKLYQTGVSAGVGGAVPVAGAVTRALGRGADQLTRPMAFRNKAEGLWNKAQGGMTGIKRDLQGLTNDILGDSRKPVISAMMDKRTKGINKNPTAAQKVAEGNLQNPDTRFGNPMVKLESDISFNTSASDIVNARYRGQKHLRAKIMDALSGTDDAYKAAETARTKATKPYYDSVEKSTTRIDSKPVITLVKDILKKNPNTDTITLPLKKVLRKLTAKETTIVNGKKVTKKVSEYKPVSLKSLSDDLGKKIKSKNSEEYDMKVLVDVKKALDKQIKQDVPEFGIAQKVHAKMSQPLNQMDIARAVRTKIGSEIKDESAKPFLRAMNDQAALIKKATGFKRGKDLEAIYKGNPKALKQIKAVVDDLEINLEASKQAGEIGNVFGGIKTGITPRLPNVLTHEVTLTNALLKRLETDKTGEYALELASLIKRPQEFAKLLNMPESGPFVTNMINIFEQLSKGVPLSTAKQAGEQ